MCPPPVMTPDAPDRSYSTRLRTAVVLTGSGTAAAYHAGVLRALHEAGLKIDLVAGRGAGVIGAFFAAVDGGAKLWDADGIWRSRPAARFYRLAARTSRRRLGARGRRRHLRRAACAAGAGGGGRDDWTPSYAGRPPGPGLPAAIEFQRLGRRAVRTNRASDGDSPTRALRAARRRRGACGQRPLRIAARAGETADPARHHVASSRFAAERSNGGRAEPGGAVESDSRCRADCRAAAVRARAQICRIAVGQSGAAGISRAARDGPRHGRASRPGVRAARQRASAAFLRAAGRRQRRTDARSRRSTWRASAAIMRSTHWPRALAMPVATEPAPAAFSRRGCLARRNASRVRPPGRAHPAARRSGARRRGAGDPRQCLGAAGTCPRARGRARRSPRPRRRAARRLRGRGSSRRAASSTTAVSPAFSSSVRRTIPLGPLDFAGVYDERSDRTLAARRAHRPRLRGRLPPVHRAGRRRRRRAHRSSPTREWWRRTQRPVVSANVPESEVVTCR